MNRFFSTILRAFTPSTSRRPGPAALRERLRSLVEERAGLAEMIPYLRDFRFEDIAREQERRIAEIDGEIQRIERDLRAA